MCKKSPEQCKAKVKCASCLKRQEMAKLRDAYLEAKESGSIKSYKITIAQDKEHDTLTLTEVDNRFEQQNYVISIKGE